MMLTMTVPRRRPNSVRMWAHTECSEGDFRSAPFVVFAFGPVYDTRSAVKRGGGGSGEQKEITLTRPRV